jgi:uncharacterized protein YigE (DUF2233 family)
MRTRLALLPLLLLGPRLAAAQPAGDGSVRCAGRDIAGARYRVCVLPAADARAIELRARDAAGRPLETIARLDATVRAAGRRLLLATNGGIYERTDSATGLLVADGRRYTPLDTTAPGEDCPNNFRCLPNGVFFVTADGRAGVRAAEDFARAFGVAPSPSATGGGGPVRLATQSGPLLVRDGALARAFNPASTSRKRRSGVGVRGDGAVVLALSVDSVTPHAFAVAFRDALGARDALFLDGEISQLHEGRGALPPADQRFASILAVTAPRAGKAR